MILGRIAFSAPVARKDEGAIAVFFRNGLAMACLLFFFHCVELQACGATNCYDSGGGSFDSSFCAANEVCVIQNQTGPCAGFCGACSEEDGYPNAFGDCTDFGKMGRCTWTGSNCSGGVTVPELPSPWVFFALVSFLFILGFRAVRGAT